MKARKPEKDSRVPRAKRATFLPISEDMRRWSALLEAELTTWPAVSTKSMFGFLAFYRAGRIFAALPRTRGFNSWSSLILKFDPRSAALLAKARADQRMDTNTRVPGKGWFNFEVASERDLREALGWLDRAYQAARHDRPAPGVCCYVTRSVIAASRTSPGGRLYRGTSTDGS